MSETPQDFLERHYREELNALEAEHARHEADEYRLVLKQAYETLQELKARLDTSWLPVDPEYHILFFASLLDDFQIQQISDSMNPNLPPVLDAKLFKYILAKLSERLEQHFKPTN